MNRIVQLKGKFLYKENTSSIGYPAFNSSNPHIALDDLKRRYHELSVLAADKERNHKIGGILVSVHYTRVIPKSRRVSYFFSGGKTSANATIVGAKFGRTKGGFPYHIITHFVSLKVMKETLRKLDACIQFMGNMGLELADNNFLKVLYFKQPKKEGKAKNLPEGMSESEVSKLQKKYLSCMNKLNISKSLLGGMLEESSEVAFFAEPRYVKETEGSQIVTIYRTGKDTVLLMKELGIDVPQERIMDGTTMLLYPEQVKALEENAPYLISMSLPDFSQIKFEKSSSILKQISIPKPGNEPVVGVIDGPFDESAYCHDWVSYEKWFGEDEKQDQAAIDHGTEVTSLIVDGPAFNSEYNDGCGRFRVRHFGVAPGEKVLSFTLLRKIKRIVEKNPEIKVWNLSLGSELPVNSNYISPVAALLDKLESEYDIIFVVAGTNDRNRTGRLPMGDPADSINSIVVNSVRRNGEPASYTRRGPVLSFFRKPDVSYFGGDTNELLHGCTGLGEVWMAGTSFAAPWITRKVAYMIYNLHLPREVAKALLIDSASKWNEKELDMEAKGFGVPPISIRDIVESANDEIKFFFYETAKSYDSLAEKIPVPVYNDKYPYIAKATLCYFPVCNRDQGVDYTNTELDIHFGRFDQKLRIKSVNENAQAEEGDYTNEEEARKLFRKWDNVKHIIERYNSGKRPKKVYGPNGWGLDIKLKERLDTRYPDGLRYGVVVTLKALDKKNRFNEFLELCRQNYWVAIPLDVQQQIDVQQKAEETIDWD